MSINMFYSVSAAICVGLTFHCLLSVFEVYFLIACTGSVVRDWFDTLLFAGISHLQAIRRYTSIGTSMHILILPCFVL